MKRENPDAGSRKPALKLSRGPYGPTLRDGLYLYPWERTLSRVVTPFEEFIHRQTATGIALMVATTAALLLANSPFRDTYTHMVELPVQLGFGRWSLVMPLSDWINEGVMTLFFLVVGLEIKREIEVGELAGLRRAFLPVFAALGGMLVPAVIYRLININQAFGRGWGIPVATDVAFCVAALVILGRIVPRSLMVFLVALAIVDDLGAVMIIAFYYTGELNSVPLAASAAFLLLLILLNAGGVRNPFVFGLVGVFLWFSLLNSGIHATVSGILVALCVPARPSYHPETFSVSVRKLMDQFDGYTAATPSLLENSDQFDILQNLRHGLRRAESPLRRMEAVLHLPVALFVVPLFALTNAGIRFSSELVDLMKGHTVAYGIFLGLVLGKCLGITFFSWAAVRLRLASLPSGMGFRHVAGIGFLGGIGFTMSIFIAELSFKGSPEQLLIAKSAVILASACAGLLGTAWLFITGLSSPEREDHAKGSSRTGP